MESIIILLLTLCLAVGISSLLVSAVHFYRWTHSNRPDDLYLPQPSSVEPLINSAAKPLSPTEKKYLHLFVEGKTTEEIAEEMHVDPSTVYTVRYRIRKKFPKDVVLPF